MQIEKYFMLILSKFLPNKRFCRAIENMAVNPHFEKCRAVHGQWSHSFPESSQNNSL